MTTLDIPAPASTERRFMRVAGWTLSGLLIAFLAVDAVVKVIDLPFVAESSRQIGVPTQLDRLIGVLELASLALYAWPRTAVLGAILLTAIFGGAVASHLRMLDPLFTHVLFGVYLGLFAWGGLWFRSAAIRRLLPFVR